MNLDLALVLLMLVIAMTIHMMGAAYGAHSPPSIRNFSSALQAL